MTEPDPAALAAQLEELRGQLARAQGDVGQLRARLDSGTGQTMLLLAEIKRLREQLQEAVDKRQLAPPPAPWWCVDRDQGEAQLAELRGWVDTFLRRHYAGYLAKLPACWPSHPESAWELGNLRAEWVRVYADPDNRDLQGALAWHDRWLPGVLGRLAGSIKCDETGCRIRRRSPPP